MKQHESLILNFPLCKNPASKKILTKFDLNTIKKFLVVSDANVGIDVKATPAKEQSPAVKSVNALKSLLTMSFSDKKWSSNVDIILDALTNPSLPLVWTLSLPNIDAQQKYANTYAPGQTMGIYRFRYMKMSVDGISSKGKQSMIVNGEKSATQWTGQADDANIRFDFYAHSHDGKTIATINFPGKWAILRLYLKNNVVWKPSTKEFIIPVTVKDELDQPFVIYLTLKFNKKLPFPKDWPSIENWPYFSTIQHEINQK